MIDFLVDKSQATDKPLLPCPSCSFPTLEVYYFCPNCGKSLKKKPPSTSIGKQISFYLLCALFPPFGLFPAVRYLMQADSKSKIIGIVGIILTVGSLIFTVIVTMQIIGQVQKTLQLQQDIYKQVGY